MVVYMLIDSDNDIIDRSRYEINRYHLTKMIEELRRRTNCESIVVRQGGGVDTCYFRINVSFDDNKVEDRQMNVGVPWHELDNVNRLVDSVTAVIVGRLVQDLNGKVPPFYITPIGIFKVKPVEALNV